MYFLFTPLSLLQRLDQIDKWLFIQINNYQSNSFFDSIMPYLRVSYYWAPLYLFLLVFFTTNYKGRGWWWAVLFLCTVSLTDIVSSRVFKEAFERLRPCQDADFFEHVRLLVSRCPVGYSFTSSHAANHFGMAAFFFFTTRKIFKKWAWVGFLWAFVVSYSQVYVGVHYPFDILGGAAIGVLFGSFMAMFFNKRFGFVNFGK